MASIKMGIFCFTSEHAIESARQLISQSYIPESYSLPVITGFSRTGCDLASAIRARTGVTGLKQTQTRCLS